MSMEATGEANPGKKAKEVGRRCSLVGADGPCLALLSSLLYMLGHLLAASLGSFSDEAALRMANNSDYPTAHRL